MDVFTWGAHDTLTSIQKGPPYSSSVCSSLRTSSLTVAWPAYLSPGGTYPCGTPVSYAFCRSMSACSGVGLYMGSHTDNAHHPVASSRQRTHLPQPRPARQGTAPQGSGPLGYLLSVQHQYPTVSTVGYHAAKEAKTSPHGHAQSP